MTPLQYIARLCDRPGFPWKKYIIGFQLAEYFFESFLSFRQYRVLQRKSPPKTLKNEIDQQTFDKSQAYGRAKAQFGAVTGVFNMAQELATIHYDLLPKLWDITGGWLQRYGFEGYKGEISHTLVFMLVFSVISTIIGLPQSYYSNFVLEEKFGFNKQTPGLWIMDKIKGFGLGIVFGAPILSGFLAIIQKTGTSFFYYLWLFSMGVQVAAITIYPTLIQPLFNKLTPMETGELRTSVEKLAERLNFPLDKLYVIDGSKRSAHSNAYFYGLPWKKQIVIYDTLIEKSNVQEVTAVLGHELGHWSLGHVTKLFGLGQFQTFYIFALFSAFIKNRSLYQSFGFVKQQPIFIGFLLFNYVLGPLGMIVNLLMTIVTRTFEFQADEFAVKLGYKTDLAKSLIRLQVENLSSMDADWMYASYHYSHPILPERLNALGWYGGEKVTDGKAADSEKPVKASDREL